MELLDPRFERTLRHDDEILERQEAAMSYCLNELIRRAVIVMEDVVQ